MKATVEVKLRELRVLLIMHDNYYNYSDDYSVYTKGKAEADKIHSLRQELDELGAGEEAQAIYNEFTQIG